MDSLSETVGNNRPIQGLSDELFAMGSKRAGGEKEVVILAQFCTSSHGVRLILDCF
jgi:hypothetical protein